MTEKYPQIPTIIDEINSSSTADLTPRFTAADLAKYTQALRARIAELEAELALYRASLGPICDQEIQAIVSNL
jgi:hypothetical protein